MTKSYLNLDPINKALTKALFDVAIRVHRRAVSKSPADTQALRGGIKVEPEAPGFIEYNIISYKEYSRAVEFGSAPHWTSVKNLKEWARRVLGDESLAYAVQRSIAKKGTKKHPFMIPAYMETKKEVASIVKKEFDKINRKV